MQIVYETRVGEMENYFVNLTTKFFVVLFEGLC